MKPYVLIISEEIFTWSGSKDKLSGKAKDKLIEGGKNAEVWRAVLRK